MDDGRVIEKKVSHLGTWPSPPITVPILDNIKSQIQHDKGTRVKLQLSMDGLRVVKKSMIQGKMLVDYIPMPRLQFFTIMKNSPDILFVVSVSGHSNEKERYLINVFRTTNAMDTSIFASEFKRMSSLQKNRNIRVIRQTTKAEPREDEINWTLRSKENDNSKRQLSQIVDIGGERTIVTKIENSPQTETRIIANGHADVFENGTKAHIYRKGKPTRFERESFESDFSDNRSEVSEGALRVELESLSQELRDIKLMLEKSTGLTTGSEPSSPRDGGFEPVQVKVHSHTVRPESFVTHHTVTTKDNIDAVVLEDDHGKSAPNGYTIANGDVTHVRVSVPDYRSYTERTGSYTTKEVPSVQHSTESIEFKSTRPSTTSYENWKKNTLERNAVHKFYDVPERIQWRSRSSKPTHFISSRPRSAIVHSSSTDAVDSAQLVEVRHHPAGVGPTYHRVSFNPRVVKLQDRKTQSLRSRGLSSTVVRPIEQVYTGRHDAKHHHSLSYRPQSAVVRPSILVKDAEPVYVEQNNNVIKTDNDDTLLDVSGIDLYKETPIEGTVIRT